MKQVPIQGRSGATEDQRLQKILKDLLATLLAAVFVVFLLISLMPSEAHFGATTVRVNDSEIVPDLQFQYTADKLTGRVVDAARRRFYSPAEP